ncbi:MAG: 50S ribosomal protein L23 [Candidatus Competibacterales bacterium]
MNRERLMKVLLAPHLSEKASRLGDEHNQVAFRVATDATKPEIKAAVELMFDVKVQAVNVVNVKGKRKRFGARFGQRKDWRKAYVALEPGEDINFMGSE